MLEHYLNRKHRRDIETIVRAILHRLDIDYEVSFDEFDETLNLGTYNNARRWRYAPHWKRAGRN
ncbi:unnamed protein product [marine sediment metagenome]|uniref:Uncharacterized protein n=1 Tax=marine sediment metagenome TaxID=412755 RepID=X0ZB27_9ZZZZ